MLPGISSLPLVWCQPAPSNVMAACAPGATCRLISTRCRFVHRRDVDERQHKGIREARQAEGTLVEEVPFATNDGVRQFAAELWWNLGDAADQAAFCAGVSVTSTPLVKVTPWTTLGN
jgi:hypothetical protein